MEQQQSDQNLLVVNYDLYAGQSDQAARGLLEALEYGQLSIWEAETARPAFVFLHYAVHEEPPEIWGHLANKNPMLDMLRTNPRATFWVNGPSAFIPSHWTGTDQGVPTSYYSWAQFEVSVKLLEAQDANLEVLNSMLARLQPEGDHPAMDTSQRFWKGMVGAITGMKMTIEACQSRHKYGQNRPPQLRRHIAAALEARNQGQDRAVAAQVLARLEEGVRE